MDDIRITWQSDKENDVFNNTGVVVDGSTSSPDQLNLDVLMVFKTTTLRSLANYLFEKSHIHVDKKEHNFIVNFLISTILYVLSPKNTAVHFFDNNEYREIDKLFKIESGERYVDKNMMKAVPESDRVIEILLRNKFIEEDGDRYYVVGKILKNIQIDAI